MKFQSPIEAQIEVIHQHLEFLKEQLIQEQIQLAEKLKSQGWIEVKREDEYSKYDPEKVYYGCWYFFNPSVPSDVIKKQESGTITTLLNYMKTNSTHFK